MGLDRGVLGSAPHGDGEQLGDSRWQRGGVLHAQPDRRRDGAGVVRALLAIGGQPWRCRSRCSEVNTKIDIRPVLSDRPGPDVGAPPNRRAVGQRQLWSATPPRRSPARPWSSCPGPTITRGSRTPTRWSGQIEEFLTGARRERDDDRVLATVLFTDIVESTEQTSEVGDEDGASSWTPTTRWSDGSSSGSPETRVKTTGDGFLATFDGPARGIRCALAISDGARGLGSPCAPGCIPASWSAVATTSAGSPCTSAAESPPQAQADEVLVSSTVKDLVAGSAHRVRRPRRTCAQGRARHLAPVRRRCLTVDV